MTDSWGWGVVTQVNPLRIRLEHDATALPVTPDTLVPVLAVGQRAWVQITGGQMVVHGTSDDGAWATYTPTVSGITLGNGAVVGRWTKVARTVHVQVKVTIGSTTVMNNGAFVSLPVTGIVLGTRGRADVVLVDVGATFYGNVIGLLDASSIAAFLQQASGAIAHFSATTPFTWVAGDEINYSATYEAAS